MLSEALNPNVFLKSPDMHCNFKDCQYDIKVISLGNIPCDSQPILQSVLKALIHLQNRGVHTLCCSTSSELSEEQCELVFG